MTPSFKSLVIRLLASILYELIFQDNKELLEQGREKRKELMWLAANVADLYMEQSYGA